MPSWTSVTLVIAVGTWWRRRSTPARRPDPLGDVRDDAVLVELERPRPGGDGLLAAGEDAFERGVRERRLDVLPELRHGQEAHQPRYAVVEPGADGPRPDGEPWTSPTSPRSCTSPPRSSWSASRSPSRSVRRGARTRWAVASRVASRRRCALLALVQAVVLGLLALVVLAVGRAHLARAGRSCRGSSGCAVAVSAAERRHERRRAGVPASDASGCRWGSSCWPAAWWSPWPGDAGRGSPVITALPGPGPRRGSAWPRSGPGG